MWKRDDRMLITRWAIACHKAILEQPFVLRSVQLFKAIWEQPQLFHRVLSAYRLPEGGLCSFETQQ